MKTEKIEFRTTPEFKELVQTHATRSHQSMAQFVSQAVLEKIYGLPIVKKANNNG